jgi:hypothetical protein
MGKQRAIINDLRRFERLCLEQAELCVLEDSRRALRKVAGDYRADAFRLERRRPAPVVRTVAFERRRRESHAISMGLTGHPFRHLVF